MASARNIEPRPRSMLSTTVRKRKLRKRSNARCHFFPEENPGDTAVIVKQFLSV